MESLHKGLVKEDVAELMRSCKAGIVLASFHIPPKPAVKMHYRVWAELHIGVWALGELL